MIPKFYLLIFQNEIVGCYALIANDFISRHDLMPWFSSLYIEENHRGKKLSDMLFKHAKQELSESGYSNLYLTTDHDDLYEKFGWVRIEDGYEPSGGITKIYRLTM